MKLVPGLRLTLRAASPDVRTVMRNFGPVTMSRGVVQISAYVDTLIASKVAQGAVSALANAQLIYTLPVSLFGMSVSAAQLPAMSGDAVRDSTTGSIVTTALRDRLDAGLRQIAFFVIPSSMAFLALGDVIAAGLLQTGRFTLRRCDVRVGDPGGLGDGTAGLDARPALRIELLRPSRHPYAVAICRRTPVPQHRPRLCRGARASARALDRSEVGHRRIDGGVRYRRLGRFLLLRAAVRRRVGSLGVPLPLLAGLWLSAAVSAAAAWGVKLALGQGHPLVVASTVLPTYAIAYLGITYVLGIGDVRGLMRRALRRTVRPSGEILTPGPPRPRDDTTQNDNSSRRANRTGRAEPGSGELARQRCDGRWRLGTSDAYRLSIRRALPGTVHACHAVLGEPAPERQLLLPGAGPPVAHARHHRLGRRAHERRRRSRSKKPPAAASRSSSGCRPAGCSR